MNCVVESDRIFVSVCGGGGGGGGGEGGARAGCFIMIIELAM